jgi:hypothetical protein
MTAGIIVEDRVHYIYRGKGGKAASGQSLESMAPTDSLWLDTRTGRGITSGTFYTNLGAVSKKAGLPRGGVHIFRHSAAKLRRMLAIEEVSSQ